jgi:hypothetical protein
MPCKLKQLQLLKSYYGNCKKLWFVSFYLWQLKTSCGLYYKSFTIVIYDRNGSGQHYKSFTIVIYDRNGSGQHYKTMILANLVLAQSVNYNCKFWL